MAEKLIARNKKAYFNYQVLDRFEAGVVLLGTEVKAIRETGVNLKESFARIRNGEVWLENCHISPYSHGSRQNHEPRRPRKLLLNRREINKLVGATTGTGLTLVPLTVYFKDGRIKVELGLARGKRLHDKREAARRKAVDKEIETELKRR